MFDVMMVIISGQTDPNLLPIYDDHYKPDRLVVVVTKKMENEIDTFINGLPDAVKFNPQTDIIKIDDDNNIDEIQSKVAAKLKKLVSQEKKAILNFTGGTKLISIGAYSAWKEYSDKVTAIYVDINSDKILEYTAQGMTAIPYKGKISFEQYFGARKVSFKTPDTDDSLEELSRSFVKKLPTLSNENKKQCIKLLNRLIFNYSDYNGNSVRVTAKELATLKDLIKNFTDQGLVELSENPTNFCQLTKCEDNACKILGGGWLEDHCYNTVCNILKRFPASPVCKNAELLTKDGVKNEYDVMFLFKGTLHVIEVKTISWGGDDSNKHQDIIHKLNSLGKKFGLKTKLCLVSYYRPQQYITDRAKEDSIEVIEGRDVWSDKNFEDKLKLWIGIGK